MAVRVNNPIFMFGTARKDFRQELEYYISKDNFKEVSTFANFYKTHIGVDGEKRVVVDQTLRDLVRHQIETCKGDPAVVDKVINIVQAAIAIVKSGSCNANMPSILLGDALDCLTLDLCDHIFSYVEEGVGIWKSASFYNSGKNNLLRMCNDLLRRLSQSRNTVFCGRIQLFLARLFPLDEKSALNLASQFNLENVTVFNKVGADTTLTNDEGLLDDAMEVDAEEEDLSSGDRVVDYKLYSHIWNLQDIFRYPVQCYTKDLWESFTKNSSAVIRVLSSYKLESVGKNHGNNNSSMSSTYKQSYFPKFLTSEKLSDLQLSDKQFRRQIFVQFLILFRYLTGAIKFKGNNLVLNESQKKWISDTQSKIYELLEETPPHGKTFANYIKHVLAREDFWVTWKNKSCPSFMKNNLQGAATNGDDSVGDDNDGPSAKRMKTSHNSSAAVCRSTIADDFINGRQLGLGSPELSKLWAICPNNLTSCQSADREFLPSLKDYFAESAEQEDPVNEIEEQYKLTRDPHFQWKGLRLLSQRSQHFFASQLVNQQFKSTQVYLNRVITKLARDFPKTNGESKNDESMETNDKSKDTSLSTEGVLGGDEDNDDLNADDSTTEPTEVSSPAKNSAGGSAAAASSDEVTSEHIDLVAEKCGSTWKKLAEGLKLKSRDIKEIEGDSDDNKMRVICCFLGRLFLLL